MDTFRWSSAFETGLDEVDRQHRRLVDLINAFSARLARRPEQALAELAPLHAELEAYARQHFEEEEQLMALRGLDPRHAGPHQREHARFLEQVQTMARRGGSDPPVAGPQLLAFLVHWLAYHILGSDQSMARQLRALAGGLAADEAFAQAERGVDAATATLLRSVTALFEVLSERNRELSELAGSLEARVAERTGELSAANAELTALVRKVEHMAMTDALTGLPNRRWALERLAAARASAVRHGQALSVMLIDADGFKAVNDHHGHAAGDAVLLAVAARLREAVRADDEVCRLGGDEFLVVCPHTALNGAVRLAERVRQAVATLEVKAGDGTWHGSVSVGVAALTRDMSGSEDLMHVADEGVYAAKRLGRNRVAAAQRASGAGA
jgi:hemerythrin